MDVIHSCCCCLRGPPDMDLAMPYTHLGKTEIYSEMLKECFNIFLEAGGAGSCGICAACAGRLRDARDFKLQVQRSQAQLRARAQGARRGEEEVCAVKSELRVEDGSSEEFVAGCKSQVKQERLGEDGAGDETYTLGSVMAAGNGTSDDDEPILNVIELEIADEEKTDVLHEERTVKSEESDAASSEEDCISLVQPDSAARVALLARQQLAMTCSVRLERLRGDEAPHASHTSLATSHRESRRASRMKETHDNTAHLRAEEAYTCDTCGKHFTGKASLIEHVRGHAAPTHAHTDTYSCRTCSVHFSCRQLFAEHTREHMSDKLYFCDTRICCEQFTRRTKFILIRHIKTHTERKRYSCVVCDKMFKRITDLKQHHRIHTGEKPYSCSVCNKKFSRNSDLIVHTRIHTGDKPYSCTVCNKKFAQRRQLIRHKIYHTGEKPYECKRFNKRFVDRGDLIRHKRIHTGDKHYTCKQCNKRFSRNSNLIVHTRIHTGDKPYSCKECNNKFSLKQNLIAHTRIHSGEKPYECDECNKRFIERGALIKHLRIHTGDKPYSCEQCSKRFFRKKQFKFT